MYSFPQNILISWIHPICLTVAKRISVKFIMNTLATRVWLTFPRHRHTRKRKLFVPYDASQNHFFYTFSNCFRINRQEYAYRPIPDIINALREMNSIYCHCQLWGILLNREGPNYEVNGSTVFEALTTLYHRAGTLRYWRAVRYCSSLLHHTVDSISPFITTVLVNGKQVGHLIIICKWK